MRSSSRNYEYVIIASSPCIKHLFLYTAMSIPSGFLAQLWQLDSLTSWEKQSNGDQNLPWDEFVLILPWVILQANTVFLGKEMNSSSTSSFQVCQMCPGFALLNRIPTSGHQPLAIAFCTFSAQNFILSLVSTRLHELEKSSVICVKALIQEVVPFLRSF